MAKLKLSDRVWAAIQALEAGETFTVADLLGRFPHLDDGAPHPARTLGKAMSWLLRLRRVRVVGRRRAHGESLSVFEYGRRPEADWLLVPPPSSSTARELPEPRSPITRQRMAGGVTRVRFGQGWKPQHNRAPGGRSLYASVSSLEFV